MIVNISGKENKIVHSRKLDSDTMMFKIVEHKVNITFDA